MVHQNGEDNYPTDILYQGYQYLHESSYGVENLNEDNNEWSSNQIKMNKTQLIFFYLKTAKKGMLNILNQCQDRSYIAYHTFYTPPETQTSTTKYKCKTNEEEIS